MPDSACQYLKKEIRCMPYTTAYAPSTPERDAHQDRKCGLFHELYNPQQSFKSCFNNQVGKEYICPQVGQKNKKQQKSCCYNNPNIGVFELCPNQGGGDADTKSDAYCRASYGPDYYNLAALGYQGLAYKPDQCYQGYGLIPDSAQTGGAVQGTPSCAQVPMDPPYTCQTQQCVQGTDGCPRFDSACRPPKSVYRYVCGDRTRCGNGDVAEQQGCGCKCAPVVSKIWNQPFNPNRQYGLTQPEEVPGYYLDVSQPPIGKRPVQVQSDRESIPSMLLCNNINLPDRCFDCAQPCWNKRCI